MRKQLLYPQRRAKAPTCVHRDRFRANIILLRLEGLKIESVAKRLKTSMATVSTWSARFETDGLDGLNDKVGRGRKPSIPQKKVARLSPKSRGRRRTASAGACAAWAATPVYHTAPC